MVEPQRIRIDQLSIEGPMSAAGARRLGEELARGLARGAAKSGSIERLEMTESSNDPDVLARAIAAELRRRLG